jgi:signal transduction histidine kinase
MHRPKSAADSLQIQGSMLASFIQQEADTILLRWAAVTYAHTNESGKTANLRFRPEAEALLDAIARYVGDGQMQHPRLLCEAVSLNVLAERYATRLLTSGMTEVELVLSLQGLRKILLQLWAESLSDNSVQVLEQVMRLNQAFDNALSAAIEQYSSIKDRCHGLFLKTLAHDLRNPLGGLEMTAQMMQQNIPEAANSIPKIASNISRSVDSAVKIACDIYDVGNMQQGLGMAVNPAELDITALCRNLIAELKARYPDHVVQFEAAVPIIGLFDESRISQAFCNLIRYASRHAVKSKPVTVTLQGSAESLAFSVRYFSDVKAADDFEAMFAPMQRYAAHVLSKKGPISELGIDLYIAHEIIVAHNGELKAKAEAGWTTFEAQLKGRAVSGR